MASFVLPRSALLSVLLSFVLLSFVLPSFGCAEYYRDGLKLEKEKRFEEASVAYQLAVAKRPRSKRFKSALVRVNQEAAPVNFDSYRRYLSQGKLKKAYAHLEISLHQKPDFIEALQEINKWTKVLVVGQMEIELAGNFRQSLNNSDKVQFVARINTPLPEQTLAAVIQPSTGLFFVEDLLYQLPPEQLSLYSLNSVVAILTKKQARNIFYSEANKEKKQTQANTTTSLKLADYGTPTKSINGKFDTASNLFPSIASHRKTIQDAEISFTLNQPAISTSYSLALSKNVAKPINTKDSDFLPRFLYIGENWRKATVDFGRYRAKQNVGQFQHNWLKLSLRNADYFALMKNNLALQPYFQEKVRVIRYGLAR